MMYAAAAKIRDDKGLTTYEYPDAGTSFQIVFFPEVNDEVMKLYKADPIFEEGIEVLPGRAPHVPTVLVSFSDDPEKLKPKAFRGKNILFDFLEVDDTPSVREAVRCWMTELPKFQPKNLVVSVMFRDKRFVSWRYNNETKRYDRFA